MSLPSRRTRTFARFRLLPAALTIVMLAGCPGGGSLSGTYEAKDADGSMTLEFKSGGKVHLTMQESGSQPDTSTADFLVDGNTITVQAPGGVPLILVRNGNTLDANLGGQIMRFEKK
jgi:hypothetical protein